MMYISLGWGHDVLAGIEFVSFSTISLFDFKTQLCLVFLVFQFIVKLSLHLHTIISCANL